MQAMAVILPGKFIFLAQPHTGSSAMVLALQDAFPEAIDVRPHHMTLTDVRKSTSKELFTQISQQRTRLWSRRKRQPYKPKDLEVLDPDGVREKITGEEHVFTIIRNPYDFLTSCFVRRSKTKNFEDFVQGYDESPYLEQGKIYYHIPDCDSILHWEKMPLCVNRVMRMLDLPEIPLERHNETKGKEPWPSYFTPKAFEIVNERFGKEFSSHYKMRHA